MKTKINEELRETLSELVEKSKENGRMEYNNHIMGYINKKGMEAHKIENELVRAGYNLALADIFNEVYLQFVCGKYDGQNREDNHGNT